MSEIGFYHPDMGYWQTEPNVPQDILDAYPEGTRQIPMRPGLDYEWDNENSEWVYKEPTITNKMVNLERNRRVKDGSSFAIEGVGFIRLTGDQQTRENLGDLAGEAQAQLAINPDAQEGTIFRDADNEMFTLSPKQILELYVKSTQHIKALYAASWALKDNPPIPVDYVDDKYWP